MSSDTLSMEQAGWDSSAKVEPAAHRRRGWVVRRALFAADIVSLATAFAVVDLALGANGVPVDTDSRILALAGFVAVLPIWLVSAKLYGLYDRDEERADYSTLDELVGVFQFVSTPLWLVCAASWLSGLATPHPRRLVVFWVLAVLLVTLGRAIARILCRHTAAYRQNTLILGAGDVGQLIGRKLLHHPEYGINLMGFVDDRPKGRRSDLGDVSILGELDQLGELIKRFSIERVIVAFSNESERRTLSTLRSLRWAGVQIDVVPRLFEVIGPNVAMHTIEGTPLVGLPPVRISRSSRGIKRTIDVIGAAVLLVLLAPVLLLVALLVKLDSSGPVLFRQPRLGEDMRLINVLKFRTMHQDTTDDAHREYIGRTMSPQAVMEANGLYKLARPDHITRVGRWLRTASIDELPQLLNVLRGEMSLVGPRPCIPYETEHFAEHHFDRFLMPAGLTGLWQVTARGKSTFGEALEMDVAYVRNWSLSLDIRLLLRTPLEILRQGSAA